MRSLLVQLTPLVLASACVEPVPSSIRDAEQAVSARNGWPQLGFAASHASVNRFETELTAETVGALVPAWTTTHGAVWRTPSVASGRVYAPSTNGKLYAYSVESGAALWTATSNGATLPIHRRGLTTPAAAYGRVFVASVEGAVYAFDAPTGVRIWRAELGARVTTAIAVRDGVVYATTEASELIALDANGCGAPSCAPLWSAELGATRVSAPAIAYGEVFVAVDGVGVAVFAAGGCGAAACSPRRTIATGATAHGWPGIAGEHLVVQAAVADIEHLLAFDISTGLPLWSAPIEGADLYGANTLPAIGHGLVVIGASSLLDTGAGEVRAYSLADGALTWRHEFPAAEESTVDGAVSAPIIAGDLVYIASNDQGLSAFPRDCASNGAACAPIASLPIGWQGAAPIVVNGRVYGTTGGPTGRLTAFRLP